MEPEYEYFNRDVSWLSFNHRVLLEADDETLPLYERINFISIYSSNLEEFYKVRVADLRASISGSRAVEESAEEKENVLEAITREVNRQLDERVRKTALVRALVTHEHASYLRIWRRGRAEAEQYAREYQDAYLRFASIWPTIVDGLWNDRDLAALIEET